LLIYSVWTEHLYIPNIKVGHKKVQFSYPSGVPEFIPIFYWVSVTGYLVLVSSYYLRLVSLYFHSIKFSLDRCHCVGHTVWIQPISINTSTCLISSPDPKGHLRYCHHLASVVRLLTFSYFNLLLWNNWAKFKIFKS
jgi:hypothetical protein